MQRIPIPPIYHSWWGCSWGLFHVQSEYGEFLLFFSPPEGDVRASLVLAKYKFCGHKFNNKTYKMKKFLLLLSCFFATWCSVQAGAKSSASSDMMQSSSLLAGPYDSDGQIKSATYDANYNEIYVIYSLKNASSAKLGLLSTRTGRIVAEYSLGVNVSTKSCRLDSNIEEGLYVLLLYVNGNIRSNMNVTITKKNNPVSLPAGDILNLSNGTNYIKVDYVLKNAQTPTILVSEDWSGKVLKGVGITNSSTSKQVVINNLPLEIGKTYKVAISEHGGQGPWSVSKTITIVGSAITGLKYENGRIKVDFTLEKRGVNVGFKVISTRTGRAYDHTYGYCSQNNGSHYLSLPSDDNGYHGSIMYVVLLVVDGQIKSDKSIAIYK